MSTGFLRNFDAANRYRQRRLQTTLAGEAPIGGVITLDPGWDAFNGSLDDQADAARAAGMNYRVDLGGIGRSRELPVSLGGGLYPTDAGQVATNVALGRLNDERRVNEIAIKNALDARGQDARNDLWSQYINQVQMSEQPSAPMDVQKSVSPGQSDHYRIRPAVLSEEQMLARMDPLKRVAYLKEKADANAKAREHELAMAKLSKPGDRFWVMRNGQPIRVTEAEYRPGDLPASTREQGRPVTSGDAGRIAEFDTSLDDLGVLRTTLTETMGATGTPAAIGASLPAWATDLTGWGTEPKKRQGVIDRVKQVIGKALEGGVLRKEDEYKYEKILPTIRDTAEVAQSKLDGLEAALVQRRQRFVDSLQDAGYETSRYTARPHGDGASVTQAPTPKAAASGNPFRK